MTIKTALTTLSLVAFAACGLQQEADENGKPIDIVVEVDAAYDDDVADTTVDAGTQADAATMITHDLTTDAAVPTMKVDVVTPVPVPMIVVTPVTAVPPVEVDAGTTTDAAVTTPVADAAAPSTDATTPDATSPSSELPLADPVSAINGCNGQGGYCCALVFSTAYIGGAYCGSVHGYMGDGVPSGGFPQKDPPPVMSWKFGRDMYGASGDTTLTEEFYAGLMSSGTFDIGYRTYDHAALSCGGTHAGEQYWADFGLPEKLAKMTPQGRSWVHCNWYDEASRTVRNVAVPNCSLRVRVDTAEGSCAFAPAGNMTGYAPQTDAGTPVADAGSDAGSDAGTDATTPVVDAGSDAAADAGPVDICTNAVNRDPLSIGNGRLQFDPSWVTDPSNVHVCGEFTGPASWSTCEKIVDTDGNGKPDFAVPTADLGRSPLTLTFKSGNASQASGWARYGECADKLSTAARRFLWSNGNGTYKSAISTVGGLSPVTNI